MGGVGRIGLAKDVNVASCLWVHKCCRGRACDCAQLDLRWSLEKQERSLRVSPR